MTEDPLRIFALFCHGVKAIGRAAAKNTLAVSLSPEPAYITGAETSIVALAVSTSDFSNNNMSPPFEAPG